MSAVDALQRFLGIAPDASPAEMLGLSTPTPSVAQIEAALRKQLARVHAHPDGRSAEAEQVRIALRLAAKYLHRHALDAGARDLHAKDPAETPAAEKAEPTAPQSSAKPPPPAKTAAPKLPAYRPPTAPTASAMALTEFDRQVLAVLVGCGGWNAESRAKLVAIANTYGISVQGLIKVITGLSRYARSGGPRIGTADITGGSATVRPPALPATASPADDWLERYTPELREGGWWATTKLSILFGVIALVAMLFGLRLLLPDRPAQDQTTAQTQRPEIVRDVGTGGVTDIDGDDSETVTDGQSATPKRDPVQFAYAPTFQGNTHPPAATNAADRTDIMIDELAKIERHVHIDDELSLALTRDFAAFIDIFGSGWVLNSETQREQVINAISNVFVAAANKPTISDQLIRELQLTSGLDDPIDVWRHAWQVGVLAELAQHPRIGSAAQRSAQATLGLAFETRSSQTYAGFADAAGVWLDRAVDDLLKTIEYDNQRYDKWELWLSAQQILRTDEQYQAALMSAIRRILILENALYPPGEETDVLGRLVSEADFRTSPTVRRETARLFEAEDVISSEDLWVFTSMLSQFYATSWFTGDHVIPRRAEVFLRRRLSDQIAQAWPAGARESREEGALAAGRGRIVDGDLGRRWVNLLNAFENAQKDVSNDARMQRWLVATWFNEAAVMLVAGENGEASKILERIDREMDPTRDGGGALVIPRRPNVRVGYAEGQPGEWARVYEELTTTEDKLRHINAFRQGRGGDLHPADAEVFVNLVYRGSPQEVHETARTIAIDVFSNGPNVIMAMLDYLSYARSNEGVSQTIEAITGSLLPSARSDAWYAAARQALVEHAMMLTQPQRGVDGLAQLLADSLHIQTQTLAGESQQTLPDLSPQAAAAEHVDALRELAAPMIVAVPTPDQLTTLERRQRTRLTLADGPMQQTVASRIAALELFCYIAAAEQPILRDSLLQLLAESSQQRREAIHILQQAVQIESAITEVWRRRIAFAPGSAPGNAPENAPETEGDES